MLTVTEQTQQRAATQAGKRVNVLGVDRLTPEQQAALKLWRRDFHGTEDITLMARARFKESHIQK